MAKRKITNSTQTTPPSVYIISFLKSIVRVLRDEKFKLLVSIFTLFFAITLTLAFVSYLFTWKVDQSILHKTWTELLSNTEIEVDNWAGTIGAVLANTFIHKWFGIASFSFIFLLIIISFRLIKIQLLPFRKTLKHTLLIVFWISVTLGFLFGDMWFNLGGGHGYFLSKWLTSVIGKFGTVALLLISLFAFIIFTFDNALDWMKLKMQTLPQVGALNFSTAKTTQPTAENNIPSTKSPETIVNQQIKSDDKNITIQRNRDDDGFDVVNYSENKIPDKTVAKRASSNETTTTLEYFLDDKGSKHENLGFEVEVAKDILPTKDDEMLDNEDIEDMLVVDEEKLVLRVEKKADIESEDFNPLEGMEDYDPRLELPNFQFPTIDMLDDHRSPNSEVSDEELISNKNKIVETLNNFKIEIVKIKALIGPTVTLYEIVPAPGVRISKIKNLEDDIALSLAALGIRIIAPMPGRGTIGIEVPNQKPEIVSMKSLIMSKKFQESQHELPIALGKTISNESYVVDLTKMPHLLVAGATGQGKSVGLNVILTSLLYKKHPSQVKFVLIDPKKVELTLYEHIEKHYLATLPDAEEAIITNNQEVIHTLASLNVEMDNRYQLLKKAQVRNIKEYNQKFISRRLNPEKGHYYLPYIVLVIDEFADLIMTAGKEIELPIARIAQLARAIGIHLIVATQRPSTNIITGVIKANFPTRMAFKVASMMDSRTILDSPGANQLIGRGDMLVTQGSDLIRVQCAFIDTPELDRITKHIGEQKGYAQAFQLPEYQAEESEGGVAIDLSKRDELFDDAARLIVAHQQGSTSLIQRKLSIGYNRAGRIIDQLEAAGVVGAFEGSKARQVLILDEYELEKFLNSIG